jgi:capsular exopolysaccharide synthesis family protein
VDLIRSYTVLDSVVVQQKLYLSTAVPANLRLFADFGLREEIVAGPYTMTVSADRQTLSLSRDRVEVDRAAVGQPLGEELGFNWVAPAADLTPSQVVAFNVSSPRDAANALRDRLQATVDQTRTFIRLELRDPNPFRAAAAVNAVMSRHVQLAADMKTAHLQEQLETLERQLRFVEADLADAERTLEAFRVATITLPSEDTGPIQPGLEMTRDPVFGEYFRMSVEHDVMQRDRERLQEILAVMADSAVPMERLEFIPSVARSSQLTTLLQVLTVERERYRTLTGRYTVDHPLVREVVERTQQLEKVAIPAAVAQLTEQLIAEEALLAGRIASSGENLSQIPPRAIEEARLRRRVQQAVTLYTELSNRFEAANLARASSVPDVRILDAAAVPEFPANDQRSRLAGMVFLGILGLGVVAVILLDRFDPRLRTPDDVSGVVGLRMLGAIPRAHHPKDGGDVVNADQLHEAFRELRTNVLYAYGSAGPIVITISSAGASEGKSFVTTKLGIAFAELGRRTLIVDADTRRGDIHRVLGAQRKPGLTDYLRGTADGRAILQTTSHPRLDFISCGGRAANSPDLIGSRQMARVVNALRQRYEVVLIDSPPLGAGSDPLVLATMAGNLLFVVRSGTTHKVLTQVKLEPLRHLPVRLLGVVLNDYVPDRVSAYRYYANYLPGYAAATEGEAAAD